MPSLQRSVLDETLRLRGWLVSASDAGSSYGGTGVRGLGWSTVLKFDDWVLRLRLPALAAAPHLLGVLRRQLLNIAHVDRLHRPLDIPLRDLDAADVQRLAHGLTNAVAPTAWVLDRGRLHELARTGDWRQWLVEYPGWTAKGPERMLEGWLGMAFADEEGMRSAMFDNMGGGLPFEICEALVRISRPRAAPPIRVVRGDISTHRADVIVTAANEELRGGGGVDAAVHKAAGPALLEACSGIGGCPTGSAVVTPAFGVYSARWIIHAVGPVYSGPEDAGLLAAAYTDSLKRAEEVGARSIAFPSLSTGTYGYPADEAAVVSVGALRSAETRVEEIRLVAFGADMALAWKAALARS